MARTGRPRKNKGLKVVQGDFDKGNKQPKSDKKYLPADAPEKPKHLDDVEGQIWDSLIEHLDTIGTLQKVDEGSLVAYCSIYARLIRNKKALQTYRKKNDGEDFYSTDGRHGEVIRTHPAVGIIERAEKSLKTFAVEFGMTPAGRKSMGYDPSQLALPFDEKSQGDDPTGALVS